MSLIATPADAMRLARTIASDISLYNEAKIVKGIQEDSLFDLIGDEINQGLQLYQSRVEPQLLESTNYFYRAIVDVILKNKAHIESEIW